VGHPLWWEGRFVVYSCCWALPVKSFSDTSPVRLGTIFYCLRFETPPNRKASSPYLCPFMDIMCCLLKVSIPEDRTVHTHHCENLKFCIYMHLLSLPCICNFILKFSTLEQYKIWSSLCILLHLPLTHPFWNLYILCIYEGYSESNLRWPLNKTSNGRKKLCTKNMYIHKVLLSVATTWIEPLVILGNKFLYACGKEVSRLWAWPHFDAFHKLHLIAEVLWSQPVL
jgi:hypothetical protein